MNFFIRCQRAWAAFWAPVESASSVEPDEGLLGSLKNPHVLSKTPMTCPRYDLLEQAFVQAESFRANHPELAEDWVLFYVVPSVFHAAKESTEFMSILHKKRRVSGKDLADFEHKILFRLKVTEQQANEAWLRELAE